MKSRKVKWLYLLLFFPIVINDLIAQEMLVISTSGNLVTSPFPTAAFFESELQVDLSFSGEPAAIKEKDILVALFQKAGKRIIPLNDPKIQGKVLLADTGGLVGTIRIPVPKLEKQTELIAKAQVAGTDIGKTIHFKALDDNLLHDLADQQIIVTGVPEIQNAFRDRNLRIIDGVIEDLKNGKKWSGIWFLYLSHDIRSNLTIPEPLSKNQIIVLLEDSDNGFHYPIALQKGQGWLIHLDKEWFNHFSINAGAQLAFVRTLNQITNK